MGAEAGELEVQLRATEVSWGEPCSFYSAAGGTGTASKGVEPAAAVAGGSAEEPAAAFEAVTAPFSSSSCCAAEAEGKPKGASASLLAQTPSAGRGPRRAWAFGS